MSDDMSMGSPSSAGEQGVLRSMQEVAMSSQEASKMLRTYNIAWWGNNYYDVNELGHISVCPDPDVPQARVDLAKLVKAREAQGQRLPALFCFPQILQHRLRSINAAFKRARESYGYNGDYFLVYPIKVNQHRRVIESLIHSGEPLGLEAGSKAELMAVLAHAGMTRSVIVCNGYKDREYIRLALIGEKMGHKVYLVIEKMSEIAIVLDEAERLNVIPRLGVRARLASQGSGKWQSSGGEKSKFGLAATQVLQLVETLREAGRLDSLQLLHFHLGSQMANIRDIATGVRESARFYVELHKLGVNIQCFDVGGGLGVDYEGTRSQSDCSVNYGLNEYANNIIWAIGDACEEHGLPHPTVITESGRAVTAHHTVLVSNIIGVERNEYTVPTAPADDAPRALQSMWETWQEMHEPGTRRSLREWLHDSQMDLHDIHIGYSSGTFSLQERAWAEQLYLSMCHEVQKQLDPQNRALVRSSMSCRSVWRTKCTSTSRCSSQCRMRGVSINCSRCCRWKGWIRCLSAARCCWTSPVIPMARSITTSTVTASPPLCRCRSTIQRTRRCSVSLWSAPIRRSLATCTTCSATPKRLTCLFSRMAAWKLSCLTKGTPWRICCNTYSSIRTRC
ncbi:biosynthetic arginine decarboxylase [Citrobacter koseri]|uniref:Arginine decarboxylase n=1 Tax=Citrobacter koseri TaxID=545 RepID=A0A078LKZ1_CITKO|nr:biosynthetic arginine decarboxylase [Citrobacter koseri]